MQKIIILSYLLVSHLGPDRPWAVIVVGRSFGAPLGGRGGLWPMSHHHWDVCRRFGGPGRSLSIFNGSHGRYNYLIPAGPGRQRRQGGGKALWGRTSSGEPPPHGQRRAMSHRARLHRRMASRASERSSTGRCAPWPGCATGRPTSRPDEPRHRPTPTDPGQLKVSHRKSMLRTGFEPLLGGAGRRKRPPSRSVAWAWRRLG